jgi:hypothetical protein
MGRGGPTGSSRLTTLLVALRSADALCSRVQRQLARARTYQSLVRGAGRQICRPSVLDRRKGHVVTGLATADNSFD